MDATRFAAKLAAWKLILGAGAVLLLSGAGAAAFVSGFQTKSDSAASMSELHAVDMNHAERLRLLEALLLRLETGQARIEQKIDSIMAR